MMTIKTHIALILALSFALSSGAAFARGDRNYNDDTSFPKGGATGKMENRNDYKHERVVNRDGRLESQSGHDRDYTRESNRHAGGGYDARDPNPGDVRNNRIDSGR